MFIVGFSLCDDLVQKLPSANSKHATNKKRVSCGIEKKIRIKWVLSSSPSWWCSPLTENQPTKCIETEFQPTEERKRERKNGTRKEYACIRNLCQFGIMRTYGYNFVNHLKCKIGGHTKTLVMLHILYAFGYCTKETNIQLRNNIQPTERKKKFAIRGI